MTIIEAERIVARGGTSATDYFKAKTTKQLTEAFATIVRQSMEKSSVAKHYDDRIGRYQSNSPLGTLLGGKTSDSLDINHYVVHKAFDRLFYVVGQEERQIRAKPAAQVTPLLKEAFGRLAPVVLRGGGGRAAARRPRGASNVNVMLRLENLG